ncbi:hypothetical protein F5148DRAFT_447194 [Russula earlei]|uniref:Uncharacterized protein n=1 Tax=Russula earlei TaxID=71964 RepID=A0ACC0U0F1_9AGAM|nr:hypothetical protein F5148DRAFT_447194 [Russula earlei]
MFAALCALSSLPSALATLALSSSCAPGVEQFRYAFYNTWAQPPSHPVLYIAQVHQLYHHYCFKGGHLYYNCYASHHHLLPPLLDDIMLTPSIPHQAQPELRGRIGSSPSPLFMQCNPHSL